MRFIFLKAEWNNLIMANYYVDPLLLKPYIPLHTELDFYNGNTYVSLVGFMFNNTRILNLKIPYHVNFEEVNLRFYVRHKDQGVWKRGVVFIKEIVPRRAITMVANNLYHEKYSTLKMAHSIYADNDSLSVEYQWKHRSGWNKLGVTADNKCYPMIAGSEEDFIAQHYWGYSKYNANTTFEYEVRHPLWNVYAVKSFIIDCDFAALYGSPFSFLRNAGPSSLFLADGSEVSILQKKNAKASAVQ